jgi:hypothetical protein
VRLVGVTEPDGQTGKVSLRADSLMREHLPEPEHSLHRLRPVTDRVVKAPAKLALAQRQRGAEPRNRRLSVRQQLCSAPNQSVGRARGRELVARGCHGAERKLGRELRW